MTLSQLPELAALGSTAEGVRIPPDVTVPLTPRVRAIIDTPELRRLARISQLGLVALVYPGATHSRFEHSLGTYRLALEFLGRLRHDERFNATVTAADAAAFLAAGLLHDVGHWPYCHPLEDMGLPELPRHESLVTALLRDGPVGKILADDWELDPGRVAGLIEGTANDPAGKILRSLLSGPIDVDKMDYLGRDSLHAGVPYGRHFDQERLLSSLCLDETGTSLAITDKGRTAAELMVFARYVMFSEVYWHHAVRSATAMLQRAVWVLRDCIDASWVVRSDDAAFAAWLIAAARGSAAEPIVEGLFGTTRRLFKRAATYDAAHHPAVHRALAGRPYADSVTVSARLAGALSNRLGTRISAESILVDAPPAEREVEFRIQVREKTHGPGLSWRRLEDLSPVVRSLAREQFDDLVKRVRIFCEPAMAAAIAGCTDLESIVLECAG
jgi:HD superfamily phosphohydrolase